MKRLTNFKHLLAAIILILSATPLWAGNKNVFTFDIQRTIDQTSASICPASGSILGGLLNCVLSESLASHSVKFCSVHPTTGKYSAGSTISPYGHYFNVDGLAVSAANVKRALSSQYDGTSKFTVKTIEGMVEDGGIYSFKEALVNVLTKDTVEFHFQITIGKTQSVSTDLPAFNHRKDKMDDWPSKPYVQVNDEPGEINNCVQANVGDAVTIGMRVRNEGDVVKFNVKNPAGKSVKATNENDYTLNDVQMSDAGPYTLQVRYTLADGTMKYKTCEIYLDVQEHQGEFYDWAEHTPYWSYDFRDETPEGYPVPTKTHTFKTRSGKEANRVDGDWWCVYWGDDLNSEVAENNKNAMTNMMKKYDTDFAYIRDVMGWPPDINARKGYKSFVYIFGSGLANDNASKTEMGGYQSSTSPNDGGNWPCVWASYYPVSRFRDDADSRYNDGNYQREAMIHEGIHATFADMNGVKNSAWFHEGGNVWLQMAMNAKRDNVYGSPGWLGVGNLICPFMPIECYSGWLQDGSFGGPSAEGVNMYNNNGQQVCTWRNLLGGVQYGEVFPLFLGACIGEGAIPWIWRYCKTRVLEGIATGNKDEHIEGIGDEAMRSLIMQYRSKLATLDFGGFSNGCRNLVDSYFGVSVKAEWEPYWINVAPFSLTPYQTLEINDAEGWMAPDTITNPGWSGGNIIPIHVGKEGCEVCFRPEDDNMRAQLCYRTKSGAAYYSQPVKCGKMKLSWSSSQRPANDVVFCVVANTDYIYTGDAQRKKHWDYRIKLGEGAYAPADINIRWYLYEKTLKDEAFETGIKGIMADEENQADNAVFKILSGVLRGGQSLRLDLAGANPREVKAHLVGVSGVVIDEQTVGEDGSVNLPANLRKGMYILALRYKGSVQSFKIFVE